MLKSSQMVECLAQETDFAEADLSKANCLKTDFYKARFFHTNLTEADLTQALNYDINAANNTLKKTRFSLPEAVALLHSLDIILEE